MMPVPEILTRCDTSGPLKDRAHSPLSTTTTVYILIVVMISTLSITSWIVRGLTKVISREQLVSDSIRYGSDIVALQETKCQDYAEIDVMNYSLILFELSVTRGTRLFFVPRVTL